MYNRYKYRYTMLFILDIEILGSSEGKSCTAAREEVNDVIKRNKPGHGGEVLHHYKVTGENRVIAIIRGDPDVLTDAINARGVEVKVNCTPLRHYENFQKSVCGNKDETLTKVRKISFTKRPLFWVHVIVDYEGKTMDEILSIILEEGKFILGAKKAGLQLDIFKVAAQLEVHVIIAQDSADDIDDLSFKLPLMKNNGNQVEMVCKQLSDVA